MERTIACGNCRYDGPAAEFSYVAQAGGTGPAALLRCPACREMVIVEDHEVIADGVLGPEPSGLDEIRVGSLSNPDREVESDQV